MLKPQYKNYEPLPNLKIVNLFPCVHEHARVRQKRTTRCNFQFFCDCNRINPVRSTSEEHPPPQQEGPAVSGTCPICKNTYSSTRPLYSCSSWTRRFVSGGCPGQVYVTGLGFLPCPSPLPPPAAAVTRRPSPPPPPPPRLPPPLSRHPPRPRTRHSGRGGALAGCRRCSAGGCHGDRRGGRGRSRREEPLSRAVPCRGNAGGGVAGTGLLSPQRDPRPSLARRREEAAAPAAGASRARVGAL